MRPIQTHQNHRRTDRRLATRLGYRSRLAGSVIAGVPGPGGLRYIGDVGSGFTIAGLRDLTATLTRLEQPDSPFTGTLPAHATRQPAGSDAFQGRPWIPETG